jgi:hypothetical protein
MPKANASTSRNEAYLYKQPQGAIFETPSRHSRAFHEELKTHGIRTQLVTVDRKTFVMTGSVAARNRTIENKYGREHNCHYGSRQDQQQRHADFLNKNAKHIKPLSDWPMYYEFHGIQRQHSYGSLAQLAAQQSNPSAHAEASTAAQPTQPTQQNRPFVFDAWVPAPAEDWEIHE